MVSENTGMLLMLGAVGLSSFAAMMVFVILVYVGNINAGYLPSGVRYPKIADARILGTKPLAVYGDTSQPDCLQRCDDNVGCMSVNYNPDARNCKLYSTSKTIDESSFESDMKGTDYYEKAYFWGRFTPKQSGSMKDFGNTEPLTGITSDKECAIRCLKQTKNPECKGFNYSSYDQKCKLLGSALEGNEKYIDATDTNYVYYGLLPYTVAQDSKLVVEEPPKIPGDAAKEKDTTDKAAPPATVDKFGDYSAKLRMNWWLFMAVVLLLLVAYRKKLSKWLQ